MEQYRLNQCGSIGSSQGCVTVRLCDRTEEFPRGCQSESVLTPGVYCPGLSADVCCSAVFFGEDADARAREYLARINPHGALACGSGGGDG